MLVKVCGITRVEDAEAAVAAGARALGLVFWPRSPRFIDPYRARAIVATLPAFVTAVGVFVDQPSEYVRGVASLVRLGAVQLHGHEDPAYAADLGLPIIKAVAAGAPGLRVWPGATTMLIDALDGERRGGTGRTVDWTAAAATARERRSLLAGGLTPENVADAVAAVRPFGVDVSSGVERAPGVKDHAKVQRFFESLHAIDHHPARS
jgi:phosphoribosylanthranilate isomerase